MEERSMNDKQIKDFIEQNGTYGMSITPNEKIPYTMDFGDLAVQYDLSLN